MVSNHISRSSLTNRLVFNQSATPHTQPSLIAILIVSLGHWIATNTVTLTIPSTTFLRALLAASAPRLRYFAAHIARL